ncbi:hypothetical protein JXJ21_03265 [candidate division KSB1 bacterium]|nr:hypothetical protein [candidate division KSB1 bacterium]
MFISTGTAALISVLLLTSSHYFNWRLALYGRELSRIESYIIGTLCLFLPAVLAVDETSAISITIVVGCGGLCVLAINFIDYFFDLRSRVREEKELREFHESENFKS